ncbi:MAG: aminotransferase class V-fold PLP-dependent enzyme [Granulosicoccus sp.]
MKEHAYFDNAATSWPKPEPVYAFMDSFYRSHGVNPGRSGSTLAVEAEQMVMSTRSMLAKFFGFSGSSNRVVFTQNGTDALNMAIGGLMSAGGHMIVSRLDHNAVLRPANHLERDDKVRVTRIAPNVSGYIDPKAVEDAIREDTRMIVLNHASNVTGTVQPLQAIGRLARQAGVILIVDAAQTAGVIPIDFDASGIGVLTFPGHKGLFGPMGSGGMIIAEDVSVPAQRFGGTGVDSLSEFQPDDYPHRLEAGTVCLPGIAGLYAAQLWFRELGLQLRGSGSDADHRNLCHMACGHIHELELAHLNRIEHKLREFSHVSLLAKAQADARVATLSFTSSKLDTQQIADQMDADHHICLRAGLQCAPLVHVDADTVSVGGAIRLSPGYFTDEEDMQQLLGALDDVLG